MLYVYYCMFMHTMLMLTTNTCGMHIMHTTSVARYELSVCILGGACGMHIMHTTSVARYELAVCILGGV